MGKLEKLVVNSPSHGRRVAKHAEKMLRHVNVRPGQSYLEIGSGNGAAAITIARKYRLEVIGTDVDPGEIRAARENSRAISGIRFLTADGTQLPFGDNQFDVVATNKATHHIPEWQAALAEMVRVLKPGGYMLYSDLVFPGWLGSLGKSAVKSMGFPTVGALNLFAENFGLSTVHSSRTLMSFDAVWEKHRQ